MKKVLIISASSFGREVYHLVKTLPLYGDALILKGFLDDRKNILQPYGYEHSVIASVEDYQPEPDDVFVCAISHPGDKKKYADMIKAKGGVFINVIHPTAIFSQHVTVGEGVIIGINCCISCDVHIGNFVTMHAYSLVGHDVRIHDYAHLNSLSFLGGGVTVGALSVVHAHAVILPGIAIGQGSLVGAGSVALKNVPDNTVVFGVPAMPVKV